MTYPRYDGLIAVNSSLGESRHMSKPTETGKVIETADEAPPVTLPPRPLHSVIVQGGANSRVLSEAEVRALPPDFFDVPKR
jgi:hypothetical protein